MQHWKPAWGNLFDSHLQHCVSVVNRILVDNNFDAVMISSGSLDYFVADDVSKPFKALPFFTWLCPLARPDLHLYWDVATERVQLLACGKQDYWHDHFDLKNHPLAAYFDVMIFETMEQVGRHLKDASVGKKLLVLNDALWVDTNRLTPEVQRTLANLQWERAFKTEFDIATMQEANYLAVLGHQRAFALFQEGASEFEIFLAYLQASSQTEQQQPYGAIVGLNEKSAVLHYETKRLQRVQNKIFLLDAGASVLGRHSDITRTYASKEAHSAFRQAITMMEVGQQQLCSMVTGGMPFADLHAKAIEIVCHILQDIGVLKGVEVADAVELGLGQYFLPHGLGHFLGVQVHDVGGKQANRDTLKAVQNPAQPNLRTQRRLEPGMVVTIEPGIYFIEMLLSQLRASKESSYINWPLVEEIGICGIRIEDDVVVGQDAPVNLTRRAFQQASAVK